MHDLDLKTVLTVIGGAFAALLAYLGGQRTGQAAWITAVSEAEDRMMARLEREVEHSNERAASSAAAEALCRTELAELRDRFNLLRAGACPPPYEPGRRLPTPEDFR